MESKKTPLSGYDGMCMGHCGPPASGMPSPPIMQATGMRGRTHYGEGAPRVPMHASSRPSVPVIDMHVHLVTFMQTTQGIRALLKAMDEGNIASSVVFGLGVKKKWESTEPTEPSYYLDDDAKCYPWPSTDEIVAHEYAKLTKKEQKRIAPMLSGFSPTDMSSIDYVEYMFEKYPFWKGIGELLLRHDDLTNLTVGETARANHPALTKIYAFCEKRRLPILIHQNSTSVWIRDKHEYLHEMREPLERHPDALFVWAHCGCSRRITIKDYAGMISGMMKEYPNLYVDLSWVVYEDIICRKRNRIKDGLVPKSQWMKEVVLRFPDRVLIGSDLVGSFDLQGSVMARYNGLLAEVPADVRDKIARLNAERIWFSS